MNKNSSKHNCPIHGCTLTHKLMPGGGIGEVCPTYPDTGCRVFFDRRVQKFYNVPGVVAPASKKRGRVNSKREEYIARLLEVGYCANDVDRWANQHGLSYIGELVNYFANVG